MSSLKKKHLHQQIARIEENYPEDNLIRTYRDFIKNRDVLAYLRFNPILFESLLQITNELWTSDTRISRLSLLNGLNIYYSVYQQECKRRRIGNELISKNNLLGKPTLTLLFDLFKKVHEQEEYISWRQREEAKRISNRLIKDHVFTEADEEWLVQNLSKSPHIVNRILRYRGKSATITSWAHTQIHNDSFRDRRAELMSWIVDSDPAFEIDDQLLKDDFDFLERHDKKLIAGYIRSNNEFPSKRNKNEVEFDTMQRGLEEYLPSPPSLTIRHYYVPLIKITDYPSSVPDFDNMRIDYLKNLELNKKFTMIWVIGYSRLANVIKADLLKKYYCIETYDSIFKVCTRNNNKIMFQWMLMQQ